MVNNLNNQRIDEEIDLIEEKLIHIEENNKLNFEKKIYEIYNSENSNLKNDFEKFNSQDSDIKTLRLENIINQIYSLQMKHFAESIMNIKKDFKKNNYFIIFDPCENIDSIILDDIEYDKLMRYRDVMNSTSIYDLFQEKIHSY